MRVLFLSLLVLCVKAQEPPRIGVGVTQSKLSLAEAVKMALSNNLEIEIEKTKQASARESIRGAHSFLDPNFRWLALGDSRDTPTGSSLASSTGKVSERVIGQNFYFRQRTMWQGLSLHADFENQRLSTNNPFTSLNPYVLPRLAFGVTLPLLRDRKTDRERGELVIRRKSADISDADFELRVIDVVARVEQAYYDLVAVRADLQVVGESVNLAQEQLDRTRRMIASGSVAPVELAAAEAELERRKDTYFSTLTLLTQTENNLKLLLAGARTDTMWKDEIVPASTERAATPAEASAVLEEIVGSALARRVELKALELRRDVNSEQKLQALNQKKIGLNLVGQYASAGLGGTELQTSNPFASSLGGLVDQLNVVSAKVGVSPLPPINLGGGGVPKDFIGGYGRSLSNLFGLSYSSFQGGLTLDWNIRNRGAESAIAQTAITERRIGFERRQLEQGIEAQVRNAVQTIATSQQRMAAAEASARAAKEKLDSETRLFQTGESTNFFVLTRQNEFSDARRRVVVATLEYNKSVARLQFSLGKTLEVYQVRVK